MFYYVHRIAWKLINLNNNLFLIRDFIIEINIKCQMTILWAVFDFSDCNFIIDDVENIHQLILTGSLKDM